MTTVTQIIPTELWPEVVLPATTQMLYQTPGTVNGAWVKRAVLSNTSGAAALVTVYKVPSGGTPQTSNQIISQYSIAAGTDWTPQALINLALPPGASIWALCSISGVINTTGSGFTF